MRISDWSSDVCSSDLNNFEFDAERNTNYEIGLKGNVLDRKLRFSAALFWTDYSDFQAQAFDGLNLVTRNAELFRIKGGELELTAFPTDGLDRKSTRLNSSH